MDLSNTFLAICQSAKEKGYPLEREVGKVVGRGFADLGFESFIVLPGKKLLSCMTGAITPLEDQDDRHLFSVPTVEDAVQVLEEKGIFEIVIERRDQRDWIIRYQKDGVSLFTEAHDSLLEGLFHLL